VDFARNGVIKQEKEDAVARSREFDAKRSFILVGRSNTAEALLRAAETMVDEVAGFILVSPQLDAKMFAELAASIKSKPLLIAWAKDDPINSISNLRKWKDNFPKLTTRIFEKTVEDGMHPKVGHTPELLLCCITDLQNTINDFVLGF